MKIIENQRFDQERALYGSQGITVRSCAFDGPADGESAFKECRDVTTEDCFFNLRYPFWHVHGLTVRRSELTELCRAALWYSDHISIEDTKLHGIKAFRECDHVALNGCDIISPEFGWSSRDVKLNRCTAESEYFFLRGEDLHFSDVQFKGKYSFQYVKGGTFDQCTFDTKDAFWHSENITVTDSVIKGEYLAWYSENLTLVRCKIIGTQPLCYCKGLRLIDCEMVDTDLAFEKSDVEAAVTTSIVSVKNPRSGSITAPEVGEIIMDDPQAKGTVHVTERDLLKKGGIRMDAQMLNGKVAVITGASYGMGQTMAELFAEEGAAVVLTARGQEKLDAVVEGIRAKGGRAVGVVADVCSTEDTQRVFATALKEFGDVDILINNAGIGEQKIIDETDDDWMLMVMNTNLGGPMRYIREALKIFLPKNEGVIINISSVNGTRPFCGATYTSTKGALNTLTKNVAMRLIDTNIRCNAVAPGATITPAHLANKAGEQPGGAKMLEHSKHFVYFPGPECEAIDQAYACLYLASKMGKAVRGQVLQVCNGAFL